LRNLDKSKITPIENDIHDIKKRFDIEQEYINRYISFLEIKATMYDSEVQEVSNILQEHGVSKIPESTKLHKRHEPYNHTEASKLVTSIHEIKPFLNQAILEAELNLKSLERPDGIDDIDARSNTGEWIDFFIGELEQDTSYEAINTARSNYYIAQEEAIREGHEIDELGTEHIDFVIKSAIYIISEKKLHDLFYARDRSIEFELTERIVSPESEINILRQGFLLLMTAFDAAVFDITRSILQKNFFNLIGVLGAKEKISLARMGRYKSFEDFRDDVIDEQLRFRYLKDLLYVLSKMGVECVDTSLGDKLIELVELVMRRNIHVHNRGIVDERYLERDDQGKPRSNLYNFKLGDIAKIDIEYWKNANSLCSEYINRLCTWADKMPGQKNNP